MAARLGLGHVAKLDANECFLGPFPGAVEAAREALGRVDRYPDAGRPLLEAIARRHGAQPTSIVVGAGADALIGHLAAAYVAPGDEAVMGLPSFVSFAQDVLRQGGVPVEVPVRPDGALDLPAMAAAVTPATRLAFVCNPNNPTGGTLPAADVERFLDAVPEHVLVVLDEAYAEFVDPTGYQDGPALALARPNVAVLRTFSKLFGLAGLRVGYLLGPPAIVEPVRRLRHWYDVTDAAHCAALACLGDPAELDRRRAANGAARAALVAVLERHGLAPLPSEASFVTAVQPGAHALAARLAGRGVLVRALGSPLGDLLRVAVPDARDLDLLDAALGAA